MNSLADRFEARNIPLPPHLHLPELLPGANELLDAFWDLSADRDIGMGAAGPIPFTAINAYALRHGFDDPEDFELLKKMIKVCDGVFLKHVNKPKAPGAT